MTNSLFSLISQIYDGDEARSDNAILRWCNSTTPKITKYLTVTSKALVKFTSGGQTAAKGFKISFETNCGYNIVTNSTGMINLHYSGPPKMCTWTIRTANPTERISLTINHFSGNASSYRDVLVVTPSVQTADIMADTYYAIGGSLMVMLSVNGPTVLQASYSAYDNCEEKISPKFLDIIKSPIFLFHSLRWYLYIARGHHRIPEFPSRLSPKYRVYL